MPGQESEPNPKYIAADHQLTPPQPEHGRRWIFWLCVVLMLLLVGILIYVHRQDQEKAAKQKAAAAKKPPVTATAATAQKGNVGVYLDALGTVTPVYTASITAQASGVITAVYYHEGQMVRKGDPLIEIDPRPYQATLMQAQGVLERDQGLLAQAQMDLDRYRAAWARNAIPKQTLDDQEKIVQQDQGTVKNDQGTVQYDEVQLSYCHIVAPISGRTGLRLVDPGNVVQSNGTNVLVVITQVQPITVIFTLAEDSLGQVQGRMRQSHTLPVDALDRTDSSKIASGKLFTIDNQIDTTTGTVKLRASFDNKTGALFPNQFVNTHLLVNTLNGVTTVPSGAIQHNGQAAYVFVVKDGKASIRNITTGASDNGQTAVQGLNPGEVVATSSFEKLQNGSEVKLAKQAPPANPAGSRVP